MNRRKRSRAFLYSFVITIAALTSLFGFFYSSSLGPQRSSLPENIPSYDTLWGRYTPSNVLSVSFENLTMLHAINSSLPPEKVILHVISPEILLNNSEVRAIASITLVSPNATVDVAFVRKPTFERFSQLLAKGGQSPTNFGDSTLYEVQVNPGTNAQPGWVAVVPRDNAIAFSAGTADARSAIIELLNVLYGDSPSILSRADVTRMLYTVGGGGGHLGIQVQNFPGVVRTGEATLVSVDSVGGSVQVSYVVEFVDSKTAMAQYGAVKSAYLSSRQFTIYDNFVKAVEYQPISAVEGAIRLVG